MATQLANVGCFWVYEYDKRNRIRTRRRKLALKQRIRELENGNTKTI